MTIGTATNHNTDFSNILGERSNATHYYTTQQIIDEELTNIQTSDAAIDSEIPNAEAKCLAFSRLCAAIETPIWLDVQRHNQLVDDIIGFHSTRLATAAMLLHIMLLFLKQLGMVLIISMLYLLDFNHYMIQKPVIMDEII